jgi:hypothetical protein
MRTEPFELLKIRGDNEDRFIVVEAETFISKDREQMLRYSLSESEVRATLKKLGISDADIEGCISACLHGPYEPQWETPAQRG